MEFEGTLPSTYYSTTGFEEYFFHWWNRQICFRVIAPYHFCRTMKYVRNTSEISNFRINNKQMFVQLWTCTGAASPIKSNTSYIISYRHRILMASLKSFSVSLSLHFSRVSQCKPITPLFSLSVVSSIETQISSHIFCNASWEKHRVYSYVFLNVD